MNKVNKPDLNAHEELLLELKSAIPIVRVNQPRRIYEVERRVDQLL